MEAARAQTALIGSSLGGFYASLGPALTKQVVGSGSPVLGGTLLFVVAGVGALSVLVLRNVAPDPMMRLGIATLIIGDLDATAPVKIADKNGHETMRWKSARPERG